MVSPESVGYLGVGLGVVLIIFDKTNVGLGFMILGIAGAAVASVASSGQEGRQP